MLEMNEPAERETLVVVDDDHAIRLSCQKILERAGFRVETFEDGARGLEGVAALRPAMAIVDLKMPGISGIEVISRARQISPRTILVVITGYATIDTAVEAMKAGAYDFLPKPFSPEALRMIVRRGLDHRNLLLKAEAHEVERELLKRRFVTFVSHQMQTPLVAVHQYLDVLKEMGESEAAAAKRREWIERCLQRTEEMQSLIRDWLTLAKIEGDFLAHRKVKVDLNAVIENILTGYEQMAAADGISFEVHLPKQGCFVHADRNCLNVLFDNLIANAIKYNKPGGKVTVTAEPVNGEVSVAVADTGIGIPEEQQPMLFQEFFRIERKDAKHVSGTGLGLTICKRIVTELGGAISVESQADAGSTFRVRLPAWREEVVQAGRINGGKDDPDGGR